MRGEGQDCPSDGEEHDACLVDLKMPDMDGIEATKRIREIAGPDTTHIITAYDWGTIEQNARLAGQMRFWQSRFCVHTV